MQVETINISKLYKLEGNAELNAIIHGKYFDDDRVILRPAIIVVAGGGYAFVSKREGEPVASYFLEKGYNAFILNYSVTPINYPTQLLQLSGAVDYLRKNAERLQIDKDRIFMVGFSAGGHLVANFATDYFNVNRKFNKDYDLKVKAVCLSYAVISYKLQPSSSKTYKNLLSEYSGEEKEKLLKSLNCDEMVSNKTLPSFVWITVEDTCVPCQSSISYVNALVKHNVKCEFHLYPQGWHGLSTYDKLVNDDYKDYMQKNATWLNFCNDFFEKV
ncbi:MAG: alpha/beta hydrolase [Clostridia bacterium]|nr:alpha/beta hydrolase [Clostridia bacterium]MBQ9513993.1 alpha/beta hydrolase [Clostridia bacterium]